MVGAVSAANSFVGSQVGDRLGSAFKTLANGNIAFSGMVTPWMVYTNFPSMLSYTTGIGQSMTFDPAVITGITNTGTAVILQASNDISVNSDIITAPNVGVSAGGNLTLSAGHSVLINANIRTGSGSLTLIANDMSTNGVSPSDRSAGAAVITQATGTMLNVGTGLLTFDLRDGGAGAGITLGNITAGGLAVSSRAGAITQAASTSAVVTDTTTLTADNGTFGAGTLQYGITLANTGNDFGGAVTATGNGITLADANNLVATVVDSGSSVLTAGGSLNLSGGIATAGTVSLNFGQAGTGGSLTLPTNTAITSSTIMATGGAGIDEIIANYDVAAITLRANALTLTGLAQVNLASIESATLTGGVGANTIDASLFTASVTINDTAGGDTIIGNGSTTTLVGQNATNVWGITADDVGNIGGLTNFSGVGQLMGGSGNDTITINADGALLSGTVLASAGIDTVINNGGAAFSLTGANTTNAWLVSLADGGILTSGVGTTTFSGISSLKGGANSDSFTLAGGTLSGAIDGGLGANILVGSNAYSVTAADIGTAAGVTGGLINIGNLTGTVGNDTFMLAGGSLTGTMDGGGGVDALSGATLGAVKFFGGGSGSVVVGALTAASLTVSGTTGIVVTGAVNTGMGAVNLGSTGAISEGTGGSIATTGALTANSAGVTLNGANAVTRFVSNTGAGTISLKNAGRLTLGNITSTGLSINNNGAIRQAAATTAVVKGTTNLIANNGVAGVSNLRYGITLANAGNNFIGAVSANGTNISLLDSLGGLVLGNINATGALTTTSKAGAITQVPLTSTIVVGATALSANNRLLGVANRRYGIALNNAGNNFVGRVAATGAAITLRDANALTVAVNGTGAATLNTAGALSVSGTLTGALSNLTIVTTGLSGTTTFGATSVGGVLNATSSKTIRRALPATAIRVAGVLTTPITVNPRVTVNGVVGARIP
jgi:hypothetical protein